LRMMQPPIFFLFKWGRWCRGGCGCGAPHGREAHLAHELGDDAVERGALEVERLARGANALLASAQRAEVLRTRHVVVRSRTLRGNAATGKRRARGALLRCVREAARRTSAVFGTTSPRSVITMRPAGAPPMVMSKKTLEVMVNELLEQRRTGGGARCVG